MKTYFGQKSDPSFQAVQMGANHGENLQQLLDDLKLQVLEKCRHKLCDDVDATEHFPYLRSVRVLDLSDCQIIESKITTIQSTSVLIDILQKRGPRAFDEFCQSLKNIGTQVHLLTLLHKTLEAGRCEIFEQREARNNLAAELQLPTPEEAGLYIPEENNLKTGPSENEMNITSKDN